MKLHRDYINEILGIEPVETAHPIARAEYKAIFIMLDDLAAAIEELQKKIDKL